MHVIGHQHIRVHRAAKLAGKLFQVMEIECVVLVRVKTGAAVIASLDEVQRKASYSQACAAGHRVGSCIRSLFPLNAPHPTTVDKPKPWSVPYFSSRRPIDPPPWR